MAREMKKLVSIYELYTEISSLEGLQYATNMQTIDLPFSQITDISPLSGMTKLTRLWINSNPISNISPLYSLTQLQNLHIQSIPVSDLSPLSPLRQLRTLYIGSPKNDMSTLPDFPILENFFLSFAGISDISNLPSRHTLRHLVLRYNKISDLSVLTGFKRLLSLNLRGNNISDISPLVSLVSGGGQLEKVDLKGNPLDRTSLDTHVPALKEAGVTVLFDDILVKVGDDPQIYGGNVFVQPADDNLITNSFHPRKYTKKFYKRFKDEFDFLFLVYNLSDSEFTRFQAAMINVSNNVSHIGFKIFSPHSQYGSSEPGKSLEKLKAVIDIPKRYGVRDGPMLHEIIHTWGNRIVSPNPGEHWGFSSANGQLGGFDENDLVEVDIGDRCPDGVTCYTAGNVAVSGFANNTIPYSKIELYLMGLIPSSEVPDIKIAKNAEWLRDDQGEWVTSGGRNVFTATEIQTLKFSSIVTDYGGERDPDSDDSQKEFREAVIFLIDSRHPATREQLDALSSHVTWFSNPAEDTEDDGRYNFYEATDKKATISMGNLSDYERKED